jgi:hypothetical protein
MLYFAWSAAYEQIGVHGVAALRSRIGVTSADVARLYGAGRAGHCHAPPARPIRVQGRASATGVIIVCGQKAALGRCHVG